MTCDKGMAMRQVYGHPGEYCSLPVQEYMSPPSHNIVGVPVASEPSRALVPRHPPPPPQYVRHDHYKSRPNHNFHGQNHVPKPHPQPIHQHGHPYSHYALHNSQPGRIGQPHESPPTHWKYCDIADSRRHATSLNMSKSGGVGTLVPYSNSIPLENASYSWGSLQRNQKQRTSRSVESLRTSSRRTNERERTRKSNSRHHGHSRSRSADRHHRKRSRSISPVYSRDQERKESRRYPSGDDVKDYAFSTMQTRDQMQLDCSRDTVVVDSSPIPPLCADFAHVWTTKCPELPQPRLVRVRENNIPKSDEMHCDRIHCPSILTPVLQPLMQILELPKVVKQ